MPVQEHRGRQRKQRFDCSVYKIAPSDCNFLKIFYVQMWVCYRFVIGIYLISGQRFDVGTAGGESSGQPKADGACPVRDGLQREIRR